MLFSYLYEREREYITAIQVYCSWELHYMYLPGPVTGRVGTPCDSTSKARDMTVQHVHSVSASIASSSSMYIAGSRTKPVRLPGRVRLGSSKLIRLIGNITDEFGSGSRKVWYFYNSLVRMSLTPTWPTGERARAHWHRESYVYIWYVCEGCSAFY